MILVYVTFRDNEEASMISERLLKKKLIACANILPIRSVYRWKGRIARDNEAVAILKTEARLYRKLSAEIRELHSYEVPCIIRLDAKANKEYSEWICSELKE